MSFIKHGDGKITNIIDEDDLTDEQKKSVKKVSSEQVAVVVKQSDASKEKKSGS